MINLIGQFLGPSGYANHLRYLANALNKLTEVSISTNLTPDWEKQVNDQELEMIKREPDNEVNLIITHPTFWRVNCQAKRNFVYLIWEGDRVPDWIVEEACNKNIDKIIVPSTHTADAFLKTCQELSDKDYFGDITFDEVLDKVALIPHGVDTNIFYPTIQPKSKRGKSEADMPPFKFLANKGLRNLEDRGGIQYLIQAYLKEFTKEDNVELILKINPAYGVPNLLKLFPELKGDIPKVRYIYEDYTSKQLNELYNECDVFVSPTRAEAFNLPCLEAMACSKPVITTNFGGQTDYVVGWTLGGQMTEVEHELEYEGVKWLTPSIEDLRLTMRYVFENQEQTKAKGVSAIETAKKYTWDSTAKQIVTLQW